MPMDDRKSPRAASPAEQPQPSVSHPVIFLIGYRGTGKTTVARLLADELGWPWLDADELLERHAGKTIKQIFAEEGEASFRDREAAVLEDLAGRTGHVIATGGGAVLRPENRALLKTGLVIWLKADAACLWQRLQADDSTAERRPALTTGGLAEIEELVRAREPHYAACAGLTIDTTHRSPEEVAAIVLDHFFPGRSS
jgi:shikimate kinase